MWGSRLILLRPQSGLQKLVERRYGDAAPRGKVGELLSVDDQIFLSTRSVFSETRMQAKTAGIADDILIASHS
jgi:hypothetical protein